MPRQKGITRSIVRRSVTRRIAPSGTPRPPRGARVPIPRLQVKSPASIFEGLPKGSIGKHLGQFSKTLEYLKGATGGRF